MAASPHIVIIGGGAIGSAIAAYLTQPERQANHPCHVTVVERDPSYAQASSALSASSIRQQFSSPINIALSRYGVDVLRVTSLDAVRVLHPLGERAELTDLCGHDPDRRARD